MDQNLSEAKFYIHLDQQHKHLLHLLVVVYISLEEVFGDEVVLHAVALLVPLGPCRVWERERERVSEWREKQ